VAAPTLARRALNPAALVDYLARVRGAGYRLQHLPLGAAWS
jgi:hypothetical protein